MAWITQENLEYTIFSIGPRVLMDREGSMLPRLKNGGLGVHDGKSELNRLCSMTRNCMGCKSPN